MYWRVSGFSKLLWNSNSTPLWLQNNCPLHHCREVREEFLENSVSFRFLIRVFLLCNNIWYRVKQAETYVIFSQSVVENCQEVESLEALKKEIKQKLDRSKNLKRTAELKIQNSLRERWEETLKEEVKKKTKWRKRQKEKNEYLRMKRENEENQIKKNGSIVIKKNKKSNGIH